MGDDLMNLGRSGYARLVLVSAMGMGMTTVGCSGGDVAGTLGQLGEGVFRYECVEDSDARCNQTSAVDTFEVSSDIGVDPELPTAVAVGARFDLTYVGDTVTDDGEFLIVDVEPARNDLVTHSGGFVIEAAGTFAFLARNGPKRIVTDFVHVDAFVATALDVWHLEQKVSSVTLDFGQETEMAVVAVSDGGIALAGALPVTWSSSDASILAVGATGETGMPVEGVEINDDEVRLVAVAEGLVTLTVTQGEVTRDIAVTVSPEVMP